MPPPPPPQTHTQIIEETLTNMLAEGAKREPVDIRLADFDDTEYHILVKPEDKSNCTVSMSQRALRDMWPMGTKAAAEKIYGKMMESKAEDRYDITLKFDLDNLPYPKEQIIKTVSELKRNLMASTFMRAFDALNAGSTSTLKPMTVTYRKKEHMFIVPLADRILVSFSIYFEDETDAAIAYVFLQEMAEVQRRVNGAPSVVLAKEPPPEVVKLPGFSLDSTLVGYISFQVLQSHVAGKKADNVATLFAGFRAYLHYHIKASKSHLHSRMRNRVDDLLKVLNRANPEAEEAEKGSAAKNVAGGGKQFRKF